MSINWVWKNAQNVSRDGLAAWHQYEKDENSRWENCGALAEAFFKSPASRSFKLTKAMESDLAHRIDISIKLLGLPESVAIIKDRFLAYHVIEKTISAEKEIKKRRVGHANKSQKTKHKS